MDFSWLTQLFNWITQVNTLISNFTSVLGFLALVGAISGYMITHARVDPFGDTYPRKPRYHKFFQSLADRIRQRTRTLTPPQAIGGANSCTFTPNPRVQGITYVVHFQEDGNVRVVLNLTGADAQKRYEALHSHEREMRALLGLQPRFPRKSQPRGLLVWEHQDGRAEFPVVVYYPNMVVIEADARTLKQVRKWTFKWLLALKKSVDEYTPAAAATVPVSQAQAQVATG